MSKEPCPVCGAMLYSRLAAAIASPDQTESCPKLKKAINIVNQKNLSLFVGR